MNEFMDYFGGMGFINLLLVYFPIGVVVISVALTMIFKKTSVSVIAVLILFGTFFAYSYSQFNTSYVDFLVALIGYIVIAFLIGKVTELVVSRFTS
ncbi:hypothetical protein [Rossellomorea marisflavi]|uniref:hypothetical protein n=1 Tax=Rossellomorea marisflavi TaxID=189381 RepID=UPI00345A6FED